MKSQNAHNLVYNAAALRAARIYHIKESWAHSVGQDPNTNLIELKVWFCFFSQLPIPSHLTLKEVIWTS